MVAVAREGTPSAVRGFIERLKQRQGEPGKPLVLMDWQAQVIQKVYGQSPREVRTLFAFVPRKNGKSAFSAALGCYELAHGERGGEIYVAAYDREQAGIIYEDAAFFVQNDPILKGQCKVVPYKKLIVHKGTRTTLRAISADASGAYGFRPTVCLIDELHLHRNPRLYQALRTGMAGRANPLLIETTTAGVFGQSDLCYREYEYAKKIQSGQLENPHFAAVIYEAGPDADWTDEEVWRKANPALNHAGGTVRIEYLREEFQKALDEPTYQNTFRREYLNQWTEQVTRWLDMGVWDENAGPVEPKPGALCYAGLDLSQTTDLTALVLAFPVRDEIQLVPYFFVPDDNAVQREKKDRVPYITWKRDGYLETTPGNVVDYSFIRAKINELAEKYELQSVAYDPWNATQLATQLAEEDGIHTEKFRQGFMSMAGPTREFEKLLVGRKLAHGGHPVLRWNASNVSVKLDPAGNMKPDKSKSHERIDGIVASIMAIGLTMQHVDRQPSVYETRGALAL